MYKHKLLGEEVKWCQKSWFKWLKGPIESSPFTDGDPTLLENGDISGQLLYSSISCMTTGIELASSWIIWSLIVLEVSEQTGLRGGLERMKLEMLFLGYWVVCFGCRRLSNDCPNILGNMK